MTKQTSLAMQVARAAQQDVAEAAAEDLAVSKREVPEGKVWVRLIRGHLDRFGVMHLPGVVALDVGFVPESAKVLSKED